MHDINKAFEFFEKSFYDYEDPSVEMATDPTVLQHVEAIILESSKVDAQQFKNLPLAVRIYVAPKMDVADMSRLMDARMANCLLAGRPDSPIMQACINYLCSWDESSGNLKLEGPALNSQENADLLIEHLSETIKSNVKCLDLTQCSAIINLGRILSLVKAPTLLKINALYSLKNLKGIVHLANSLEELQARDLYVLKSLEDLNTCTKLKKVDLSNCKILDDLRPLQALVHLEELTIRGCYHFKFLDQVLPKLSSLKRLDVSYHPLFKDIRILLDCHELEYLDISHTAVEDIKPLRSLKKLKSENIKLRN